MVSEAHGIPGRSSERWKAFDRCQRRARYRQQCARGSKAHRSTATSCLILSLNRWWLTPVAMASSVCSFSLSFISDCDVLSTICSALEMLADFNTCKWLRRSINMCPHLWRLPSWRYSFLLWRVFPREPGLPLLQTRDGVDSDIQDCVGHGWASSSSQSLWNSELCDSIQSTIQKSTWGMVRSTPQYLEDLKMSAGRCRSFSGTLMGAAGLAGQVNQLSCHHTLLTFGDGREEERF